MMSGEDVVGMVEAEVQKLIKSDPERYEIMPYPKGQKEGNIIKDENGKDVRIIKLDYLRPGLCVVDTIIEDSKISKTAIQEPSLATKLPEQKQEGGYHKKNKIKDEIGYITILCRHFGDMKFHWVTSPKGKDNDKDYIIIEFEYLPVVFIGDDMMDGFQKIVKFMLVDIFELVKIFENKAIRPGIRNEVENLVGTE